MTLATIFRTYGLELFETTDDDVVMASSCMISLSSPDSKGIRVMVGKDKNQ